MANHKYDNLIPLMAAGGLAWDRDKIMAVLFQGAVYEAGDQRLLDVAGTEKGRVPMPNRSIGPTGTFLGSPVSFPLADADVSYAVIIVKDDGSGNPWLISFYDANDSAAPIRITNSGSMTVRPLGSVGETPGTWVQFAT